VLALRLVNDARRRHRATVGTYSAGRAENEARAVTVPRLRDPGGEAEVEFGEFAAWASGPDLWATARSDHSSPVLPPPSSPSPADDLRETTSATDAIAPRAQPLGIASAHPISRSVIGPGHRGHAHSRRYARRAGQLEWRPVLRCNGSYAALAGARKTSRACQSAKGAATAGRFLSALGLLANEREHQLLGGLAAPDEAANTVIGAGR